MYKRLKYNWVCSLLLLLLLSACGQEKWPLGTESDAQVILYTSQLTTKSGSLSAFNNTPINMFRGISSGNYTESWPAVVGSDGIMRFVPVRFYPFSDEDIYLRGFYPNPTEAIDGGRNLYTFDLSKGDTDLITGNEVKGSYYNQIRTLIQFEHRLAQIQFQLFTDGSFPAYRHVYEIWIHGVHKSAQLNLKTNELVFSLPDSIRVYNYKNDPLNKEKGFSIPLNTPALVGNPAMFESGKSITMSIVFDQGATNHYPIHFERAHPGITLPQAGYSYRVEFLLTAISLVPTVTISPWISSTTGIDMGTIW